MSRNIKSVSIMGAGRVGLTYACFLAGKGIKVKLFEKDGAKRTELSKNKLPFHEPDLRELFSRAHADDSLQLVSSVKQAVNSTEATYIAVGTPSLQNGSIDLSQIRESIRGLGAAVGPKKIFHIIVVQSTVVPGTTIKTLKPMLEKSSGKMAGKGFGLAVQPEFLREGSAVYDVLHPSRIVIGTLDPKTERTLTSLARRLYERSTPIVRTNPTTAEMIKYASNVLGYEDLLHQRNCKSK